MRYLHLFLIFNIIVCYAGICGDTVIAAGFSSEAPESCHGAEHKKTGAENDDVVIIGTQNEDAYDSPCCLDSLTSSSPDEYTNPNFTLTQLLPIYKLNSDTLNSVKSSQDQLIREHDPPDLQVHYSTFLL